MSVSLLGTGYLLALISGLIEWPSIVPCALLLLVSCRT